MCLNFSGTSFFMLPFYASPVNTFPIYYLLLSGELDIIHNQTASAGCLCLCLQETTITAGWENLMGNEETAKKPNGLALMPIVVFLALYLGTGIYFEYLHPLEGQMGFYIMSVVVAFSIALIVAFMQNRSLNFDQKIHVCARGIGDDNITIMLFIFLAAGAFGGIAQQAGGAASTANLLLSIIPGQFAIPGLFLIASLISMAMGTSVGTITILVPIAAKAAENGGLPLALCVGTVVGGAMFGDNLSFISDTTIAATKTQGVKMKDKFRTNFRIALPAALATLAILVVLSIRSGSVPMGDFSYNLIFDSDSVWWDSGWSGVSMFENSVRPVR